MINRFSPRSCLYLCVSGNFMTALEARHIAQQYVSDIGEVLPEFMFGLGDEEEFVDKYYFDFIWLTLTGQIPEEPPVAGGARGLTVNKYDKKVELISHGGYGVLRDTENKLTETYQLFSDFKNGKTRLQELKAKFDLTSEQLLELSKVIKDTELNREAIYAIINGLLDKVKNYR
ncbi:hypothetical protein ESA94_18730 [Lacibacter luteus]|uniref:Uncharacterized protein n=1 Tax=Lacibacter luteus TaxID=2508719 RepID=A0A4Q1CE81_9BACT|nr:hypothetical protein [Lacibacter luteus]RXK58050.1 hypothetical protein ESA94_18730 [Lacibacter luteus]